MSAAKHTPGPWHLRLSDNATPHIEHGDCRLDDVGELANRICVMPAEIERSYNSFANARLIASAPDLLEALLACVEPIEPGEDCPLPPALYNKVCAAIAKAEVQS